MAPIPELTEGQYRCEKLAIAKLVAGKVVEAFDLLLTVVREELEDHRRERADRRTPRR